MTEATKETPSGIRPAPMEVEEAVQTKEEDEQRDKWSNKIEFLLSIVGLCIGLGNIWRFPYLCYTRGGGAFLIPYLITLVIGGIPILYLEHIVGQVFSIGGLGIWRLCPLFKGVGIASVVMAFWLGIYYIVILAYSLRYLVAACMPGDLPWSRCNATWNTNCCRDGVGDECNFYSHFNKKLLSSFVTKYGIDELKKNQTLLNMAESCETCTKYNSPETEFWKNEVLHESRGIEEIGQLQWLLAFLLLVAWMVCYFSIWKGVKLTGKVVYVTALFPYFIMVALFFRAVTLPGASIGIQYYLFPDPWKLLDPEVWLVASSQIFFTYGLGLGTHVALASYNPKNNNCEKDVILIAAVNTLTSLFSGFISFAIIGYLAHIYNQPVSHIVDSGPGLVFVLYTAALKELPGAKLWTFLFFFMLFLVGLDSQFCTLEGLITAVIDEWPKLFRRRRSMLVLGFCAVSFLAGLFTVTEGGIYAFILLDHYSASGAALLFLIFAQCVAFSWCLGTERFSNIVQRTTTIRLKTWWKVCWTGLTPILCLFITVFSLAKFEGAYYPEYQYPWWANLIGGFVGISSIIFIPGYMLFYFVWYMIKHFPYRGGLYKHFKEILRPSVSIEEIIGKNN